MLIDWAIFFIVLAEIETGGAVDKINEKELAYGTYQIRPIFLEEYYRITNNRVQMLDIYQNDRMAERVIKFNLIYHGSLYKERTGDTPTPEVYARMFNGGPSGYRKQSTIAYGVRFSNLYTLRLAKSLARSNR